MKKVINYLGTSLIVLLITGCSILSEGTYNPNVDTKMFETVLGSVEIPTNPQRIVTDFYLGEFLILDVKPIIASDHALDNLF